MHIVCPHCTTSYAVNPATLGAEGRTVRCSRCKEVWLARPQDAMEAVVPKPAMAEAGRRSRTRMPPPNGRRSPGKKPSSKPERSPRRRQPLDCRGLVHDSERRRGNDWQSMARHDAQDARQRRRSGLLGRLRPRIGLPTACAGWARWCWH